MILQASCNNRFMATNRDRYGVLSGLQATTYVDRRHYTKSARRPVLCAIREFLRDCNCGIFQEEQPAVKVKIVSDTCSDRVAGDIGHVSEHTYPSSLFGICAGKSCTFRIILVWIVLFRRIAVLHLVSLILSGMIGGRSRLCHNDILDPEE